METKEFGGLLGRRFRRHGAGFSSDMVAHFCGVLSPTIARWRSGKPVMGGQVAIKLWYFMAVAGIESPELHRIQKLNPFAAYVSQLLAFSVIDLQRACEICGVNEHGVLKALRGDSGKFSKPACGLEELELQYGPALKNAMAALYEQLPQKEARNGSAEASPSDAEAPTLEGSDESGIAMLISIAEKISIAAVNTRYALTLSEGERAQLRSLIGKEQLFELILNLGRLSGEKAYNERR